MRCYKHQTNTAIGSCSKCGKAVCSECAVDVKGQLVCRDCLAEGVVSDSKYDPNTLFAVELIAGFFGILGVGYLLAGRTEDGILRLVVWLIYDVIAAITISLLIAVIVGIICIPIQLIIQVGIPLWSATTLKNDLVENV